MSTAEVMDGGARVWVGAWTVAVLVLSGAIVASCGVGEKAPGTPPESEPGAAEVEDSAQDATDIPLTGTNWRLVEIQSMDDAVGTLSPEDPSLYTMTLNRDGTVNMRLDCNRASGTWSAEPSDDGSSGGFEFGPLAATKALCPPPSLDERITAQAEWVRSYLLNDGRLYLSLMADGGIQVWAPLTN